MDNVTGRKVVEVIFVSDNDVEKKIISSKDFKKAQSEKKQGRKLKNESGSRAEEEREELNEQSFEDSDTNEKPTELFEVGDIRGQEMFGFQTPKKKNVLSKIVKVTPQSGMVDMLHGKQSVTPNRKKKGTPQGKVNDVLLEKCRTPLGKLNSTPLGKLSHTPLTKKLKKSLQTGVVGTPRTSSYKISTAKTPYSLRRRLKSKIARSIRHIHYDSSESDFSGSESDYKPSDTDSSSSSTEDDTGSEVQEAKSMRRQELRPHDMEYVLEAEEFFSNQKSITSNHTLNRLRQPRLAEEQLKQLLENMTLSHQEAIHCLSEEYFHCFEKWMFALREQYSVLLYGLGSKLHTLQYFRKTMLQDQLVLEVNGFFPSLTIKEVVESIADELLELSYRPAGLWEYLEAIKTEISSELYVIIHNLDGPMLRSDKSQDILSRVASMQNVHLIASIDHINASLIWDNAKLSRYNFLWWDVTSFQPYKQETQFETSILVQQSGKLALSSLSNVFHSLTTNARSIFIIMVRYQLDHHKDPVYQGMAFKDLYWSAREALLVSSDIALRAQLTEFLDHRLVRQRRGHDGAELLQVPIDIAVLKQFLEQVGVQHESHISLQESSA